MSHFPSNNDPRLHSQHENTFQHLQNLDPIPNPCQPNLHMMNPQGHNSLGVYTTSTAGTSFSNSQQQQVLDHANFTELQLGYHDAWWVCNPDFKSPFTSLEDAYERLLPYHVVADYEEEEDDKILESGEMISRSQQWDRNISDKVAEYTATFEKQVQEFNLIFNKQNLGDMRTEERLMIEHMLLQDEKRAVVEVSAELERQKAYQMTSMAHSRAYFPTHSDMLFEGASLESQTSNIPVVQNMNQQDQVPAMTSSGRGNIGRIDENGEAPVWRDE